MKIQILICIVLHVIPFYISRSNHVLTQIFFSHQEHTGRVFRLQFDEFQIVSSSHDDSILIWDFLNVQDDDNKYFVK